MGSRSKLLRWVVSAFALSAVLGVACSDDDGSSGSCDHLCRIWGGDQGWTTSEEDACIRSCTEARAGVCTEPFCVYLDNVCTSYDAAQVQRCTQRVIDAVAGHTDWESARDAFFDAFCSVEPCCVMNITCF